MVDSNFEYESIGTALVNSNFEDQSSGNALVDSHFEDESNGSALEKSKFKNSNPSGFGKVNFEKLKSARLKVTFNENST